MITTRLTNNRYSKEPNLAWCLRCLTHTYQDNITDRYNPGAYAWLVCRGCGQSNYFDGRGVYTYPPTEANKQKIIDAKERGEKK